MWSFWREREALQGEVGIYLRKKEVKEWQCAEISNKEIEKEIDFFKNMWKKNVWNKGLCNRKRRMQCGGNLRKKEYIEIYELENKENVERYKMQKKESTEIYEQVKKGNIHKCGIQKEEI